MTTFISSESLKKYGLTNGKSESSKCQLAMKKRNKNPSSKAGDEKNM